jgi:putative transcriptional regulator
MAKPRDKPKADIPLRPSAVTPGSYLDGKLLIAMPDMSDENFQRTVIYMCLHSPDGAMGLIVNRPAMSVNLPRLLVQLEIIDAARPIRLPEQVETMKVLRGGPVEERRGFVLHSSDFFIKDSTVPIDGDISLTATVDILKAIATGGGPRQAILALGCASWGAGQLEFEIQRNDWLYCPADAALVFDDHIDTKYHRALQKIGIHPGMLSNEAGHA